MSTVHLTRASGLVYVPPVSLAVRGFVRPRAIPLLSLTGRDGAVVPGRVTLEPRRGTLEGTLRAATFAGAETLRDELLAALADAPLQLRLGGVGTRYLTVWPESVDDTTTEWPSWPRFNVPLVAPDPYWHGHTETWIDLVASQMVVNHGSAIVEPVIRVVGGVGGASAISVSNTTTGQTVTFSGTVAEGQVLLIDGHRRTVTRAGVGVLTLVNQAFKTSGFSLRGGNPTDVHPDPALRDTANWMWFDGFTTIDDPAYMHARALRSAGPPATGHHEARTMTFPVEPGAQYYVYCRAVSAAAGNDMRVVLMTEAPGPRLWFLVQHRTAMAAGPTTFAGIITIPADATRGAIVFRRDPGGSGIVWTGDFVVRRVINANTITSAFTGAVTTFRLEYRARWL